MDARHPNWMQAVGSMVTALICAVTTPAQGQAYQSEVMVSAHAPVPKFTRYVPTSDLALATDEGQKALRHRVQLAITEACPALDEDGSTYDTGDCSRFALAGVRPQMQRAIASAKAGEPMLMSVAIVVAGK